MSTTPVSAMSALRAASRVASRVVSSGAGSEAGAEGAGVGGGGAFWELLGLQRPVMVAAVVVKALSVSVTCVDSVYSMVVSRCCPCIFKAWDKEYKAQRPARIESSGSLAYRGFSPQSWSRLYLA